MSRVAASRASSRGNVRRPSWSPTLDGHAHTVSNKHYTVRSPRAYRAISLSRDTSIILGVSLPPESVFLRRSVDHLVLSLAPLPVRLSFVQRARGRPFARSLAPRESRTPRRARGWGPSGVHGQVNTRGPQDAPVSASGARQCSLVRERDRARVRSPTSRRFFSPRARRVSTRVCKFRVSDIDARRVEVGRTSRRTWERSAVPSRRSRCPEFPRICALLRFFCGASCAP